MNVADKTYDPTPARRIACIGLGTMGAPMAAHLQRAGHTVTVYNRTAAKAAAWVQAHGGQSAPTPREAAQGADIVVTDTWVSMGQDHAHNKLAAMAPFQVDARLMALAKPDARFLHCLPAHVGDDDVIAEPVHLEEWGSGHGLPCCATGASSGVYSGPIWRNRAAIASTAGHGRLSARIAVPPKPSPPHPRDRDGPSANS